VLIREVNTSGARPCNAAEDCKVPRFRASLGRYVGGAGRVTALTFINLGIMHRFALLPWMDENGVPPVGGRARVCAGRGFAVVLLRAAGRKVQGCGGALSVVTVRAWTARGRDLVRVPGPSWWGTTVAAACACVSLLY
jgi:hypothetical protein